MGAVMQEATEVTVSDLTWHEAMRVMDPLANWPDNARRASREAASDYPIALVQAVIDYLSIDLTCDHAVNICMCNAAAVVAELQLNLRGRQTCPGCGGEGFTWSRERYEAARAKQIAEWGGQELYDIGEGPGYEPCEQCDRAGTVTFHD